MLEVPMAALDQWLRRRALSDSSRVAAIINVESSAITCVPPKPAAWAGIRLAIVTPPVDDCVPCPVGSVNAITLGFGPNCTPCPHGYTTAGVGSITCVPVDEPNSAGIDAASPSTSGVDAASPLPTSDTELASTSDAQIESLPSPGSRARGDATQEAANKDAVESDQGGAQREQLPAGSDVVIAPNDTRETVVADGGAGTAASSPVEGDIDIDDIAGTDPFILDSPIDDYVDGGDSPVPVQQNSTPVSGTEGGPDLPISFDDPHLMQAEAETDEANLGHVPGNDIRRQSEPEAANAREANSANQGTPSPALDNQWERNAENGRSSSTAHVPESAVQSSKPDPANNNTFSRNVGTIIVLIVSIAGAGAFIVSACWRHRPHRAELDVADSATLGWSEAQSNDPTGDLFHPDFKSIDL